MQRALLRYVSFMLDLRPFWPRVVPAFIRWMRMQFESEGSYGGSPWAPLSPEYLAWKMVHYPGKSILQAEGDLRQAASRPEREARPLDLVLTIVDPKIEYHQEGTDNMPARPLIFEHLPPDAVLELEDLAEEYADDMARRAGFK